VATCKKLQKMFCKCFRLAYILHATTSVKTSAEHFRHGCKTKIKQTFFANEHMLKMGGEYV